MSDDSRSSLSGGRTAAVIPAAGRGVHQVRHPQGASHAERHPHAHPRGARHGHLRAVSLVVVVAPPDGAAEVKALLGPHTRCPSEPTSSWSPAATAVRSP